VLADGCDAAEIGAAAVDAVRTALTPLGAETTRRSDRAYRQRREGKAGVKCEWT
jgi:hypothetical protein